MTFAASGMKSGAIKNGHVAATVMNQPFPLQLAGNDSYGFPAHTKQAGQQHLGDIQLIGIETIEAAQEPTTKPLLHGVALIADGDLSYLCHEYPGIAKYLSLQAAALIELPAKQLTAQSQGHARTLHHSAARDYVTTPGEGNAEHAFAADHGQLGRVSISGQVDHRNNATGGEVDVFHHLTRLNEDIPKP
jgi:hypothetical protein